MAAYEELKIEELTQKENLLKMKVKLPRPFQSFGSRCDYAIEYRSPEYTIDSAGLFQVEVSRRCLYGKYRSFVFVRFAKFRHSNDLNYIIYLNSKDLNVKGKTFTSDNDIWHVIDETESCIETFDVSVEMHPQPSPSTFASLHDDTELTDFELRGEDGCVRVHRVVLAAASPVLRRMLAGEWRETAEGHVHVSGTTKATLEHFKDFLYLDVLPKSDVEQLLLLSMYYMMPKLEQLCVDRLVRGINARKTIEVIEFAVKNNCKRLMLAVFECLQKRVATVTEICKLLNENVVASAKNVAPPVYEKQENKE